MQIVTLTTDFGLEDYFVAVLKGCLLQRSPDLCLLDISHQVKPYDIVQGAFILKNAYTAFPTGTIHLVTINNRTEGLSFIAFEHEGHRFIGPDNGIFSLMFGELPEAWRLEMEPHRAFPMNDTLSRAVSHLVAGKPVFELGLPAGSLEKRIALQPVLSTSQIRGSVIYVDHYDNVVVNIPQDLFEKVRNGRRFGVFFKRHDPITSISRHYNEMPVGETLCLFNAAGFLEIAINMGTAGSLLGLKLDDMVQVDFY